MEKTQSIADINLFKQIFSDTRQFIHIVKIIDQEVDTEGGSYNLNVNIINTDYDTYLNASFDQSIQGAILKNDLWLACFINGDINNGFLLRKLCNLECKVHPKARMDETVITSAKGKKINISNDPSAKLGENAVLGKELVAWMLKVTSEIKSIAGKITSLNTAINTHIHTAPTGPTTPNIIPSFTTGVAEGIALNQLELKIQTDKFLSDLFFIQEKSLKNSPKSVL